VGPGTRGCPCRELGRKGVVQPPPPTRRWHTAGRSDPCPARIDGHCGFGASPPVPTLSDPSLGQPRHSRGRSMVIRRSAGRGYSGDLPDHAATRRHPHQLRGRRGLDGHQALEGDPLLGQPDSWWWSLFPHGSGTAWRGRQPGRRLQCRVPHEWSQRGLLHGRQDHSPPSDGRGIVRHLPQRSGDRRPVGP
jgi:hypothetical protein